MKTASRPFRLAFGLTLFLSLPSHGAGLDPHIQAEVDQLFAAAEGYPGAGLLIVQKGEVLCKKAYGLANTEWELPNAPQTKFRIGSVTKSFTAVAVLQLHEKALLKISDPVGKYLPDYPNANTFTIRHLLTHTSGLPGSRGDSLLFTPGDRVDYSNEGYQLLGRIIEKVSGKRYEEYLTENIFEPLRMKNSGLDRAEIVLKQRASGYAVGPDGTVKNAACTDASNAFSAGGLFSTVEDLCLFDQALYGDALLKQSTLREAFTPVELNDGRKGQYGYGWMLGRFRGLAEVGHGGDIEGFNSYLLRFPGRQCTFIVLCNLSMRATGKLPTAGDLAHRLAALVLKEALQPDEAPKAFVLDVTTLDRYVGTYVYEAPPPFLERTGKTLAIVREGDRLFGVDKMGKSELIAESASQFTPKGSPVKLRFSTDTAGQINEVFLNIGGLKEIPARRAK